MTPTLPPSKRPRVSSPRVASPRVFGLLDLPESALLVIFDLLAVPLVDSWLRRRALCFTFRSVGAPRPRVEHAVVAAGGPPYLARAVGAHALAAAAPRLAEAFRRACVGTLIVRTGERGEVPEGVVSGGFERFGSVESLVVVHPDAAAGRAEVGLKGILGGKVVPGVARLVLRRARFGFGDVEEIARAFPNLGELVLLECSLTDNDFTLIAWKLGPRLRTMRVMGDKIRSELGERHEGRVFGDAGAVSIRAMADLQVLCLDRHTAFSSRTFSQFSLLRNLRSLNVDCNSEISDNDVAALSELRELRNLSVAACPKLTHRMLAHLPSDLETLNISRTEVLCWTTSDRVFATSPPVISRKLATLHADQISLSSWLPLVGIASLRHLYMRKSQVSASHAKRAFESWPLIWRIDISGCVSFGNGRPARRVHDHDRFAPHENRMGDECVAAISYVSRHVKELNVDCTDITCFQWVTIAHNVMMSKSAAPGHEGTALQKLTFNDGGGIAMDWNTKQVALSVRGLLSCAFSNAVLRVQLLRRVSWRFPE